MLEKGINKYRIRNLDCAGCAGRIELELSKQKDIRQISVDPVNSILETDLDDISRLNKLVKKIDPGAVVEEFNKTSIPAEQKDTHKEIFQIAVVILLLLTAVFFSDELRRIHQTTDTLLLLAAYFISGWGVILKAFRNLTRGRVFDENFLMTIATAGAIVINEIPEAVAVMLFYNVGEYFQGIAVKRSRRSVKALLSIRPDYANLISNGNVRRVSPEEIIPGELIQVKPGEKIPLDGIIVKGSSYVDTFALTGESIPRSVKEGEELLSGMINKQGLIILRVTKTFSDSSFTKIINLVEGASKRKAQTEKFISKFAFYYTPAVVALALIVAFMPPLLFTGEILSDWVYRALVMLVVSCPCALVISIPLGYFGGIGGASRRGILVKGSNYLDALTELKTVVFDKTGTLTKGVFKVTEVVLTGRYTEEELIRLAAHAEYHSSHPIATSISEAYPGEIDESAITLYTDIQGRGIKSVVEGKEIIAGNDSLLHQENILHDICLVDGTVVHIAVNGEYSGYIIVSDEIREKTAPTLQQLADWGIRTIMLTGDNEISSKIIAGKLNLDKYYSELLPEDKVSYLEKIMKEFPEGKTAFVGDGINDAPVIARSDIGFAMGGLGSDAAVEASDIVIMEDDPSKIIDAISIARKTRKIVWQNIFFAIGVKLIFIILGGLGIASMWEAVFGDMGVALIAIVNSTRALRN
jgi:Zn2+/Cd2+-exporting ATPase